MFLKSVQVCVLVFKLVLANLPAAHLFALQLLHLPEFKKYKETISEEQRIHFMLYIILLNILCYNIQYIIHAFSEVSVEVSVLR